LQRLTTTSASINGAELLEMAGSESYRRFLLLRLTFDCRDPRHSSCCCRQMDSKEKIACEDFDEFNG